MKPEPRSLDKAHLPVATLRGTMRGLDCKTAAWSMMGHRIEKEECELWGQQGLDKGQNT